MNNWIVCVALSASAGLMMIGVGMIVALLPRQMFEMTGTLESVGLVASTFALSYVLAQVPVGVLSDRWGSKRFLVAGYLICAVAGVVFHEATNAGGIFLGRAIQGIGEAPVWALGPAILAAAYPRAKGRVIGIYKAAVHLGLTLGPLAGLGLIAVGGVRAPYLAFSVLCLVGGLGLSLVSVVREERGSVAVPGASLAGVHRLVSQSRPRAILLGILLYGACYGSYVSVLPVGLSATHGLSGTAISVVFVVFYAAISVSQLVAGPLSDRHGRDRYMVAGLSLAAVGFAAIPATDGYGVFAGLATSSFGLGVFCVASLAALNESAPAGAGGTVSGCYYLVWGSGYVLGPVAVAYLAEIAPGYVYFAISAALAIQVLVMRGAGGKPGG